MYFTQLLEGGARGEFPVEEIPNAWSDPHMQPGYINSSLRFTQSVKSLSEKASLLVASILSVEAEMQSELFNLVANVCTTG